MREYRKYSNLRVKFYEENEMNWNRRFFFANKYKQQDLKIVKEVLNSGLHMKIQPYEKLKYSK